MGGVNIIIMIPPVFFDGAMNVFQSHPPSVNSNYSNKNNEKATKQVPAKATPTRFEGGVKPE